ncbi:YidB family protein [Streptomyces sp. NPDC056230]|uniref:YidB family protein n=1 Tax=Streptomyces sp. NPDC056230 TaxID=3345754 RepID=UPI0035D806CD
MGSWRRTTSQSAGRFAGRRWPGRRLGAPGGAGNILGALPGGGQGGSGGSGNALEGLIGMRTGSGLVDRTHFWIGTGENQVVSDARIAEALPDETLRRVAREAGVSTERAADQIARSLFDGRRQTDSVGRGPEGRSIEELVREQQL